MNFGSTTSYLLLTNKSYVNLNNVFKDVLEIIRKNVENYTIIIFELFYW